MGVCYLCAIFLHQLFCLGGIDKLLKCLNTMQNEPLFFSSIKKTLPITDSVFESQHSIEKHNTIVLYFSQLNTASVAIQHSHYLATVTG